MQKNKRQRQQLVLFTCLFFSSGPTAWAFERPVKLDLQNPPQVFDPQLRDHVIAIRKRIQSVWVPSSRISNVVKIRFVVEHGGQLEHVQVERSSGDKLMDQRALEAIYESTPFPPWHGQSLDIEADFNASNLSVQQLEENRARIQSILARREQAKAAQRQQQKRYIGPPEPVDTIADNSQDAFHTRETTPENDEQQSNTSVLNEGETPRHAEEKWKRPLSYIQYKNITSDQQQDYLRWLDYFISLPAEQKFPFLKPNSTANHKPVRKRI
jgi:TonB family protein